LPALPDRRIPGFGRPAPRVDYELTPLEQNQRLVDTLQNIAFEKRITPTQFAIAWVLAKGKSIVPLIGARTRAQLRESLCALDVELSPADLARVEQAIPATAVAGTRYDERQMQILDSER
jgi:aryl-alcohol dehydrogenase-like predicted oxidoreductase